MSTQKILLCHPGTWIDQKLFLKLTQLKNKLDVQSVIDESLKEKFKSLISHHLKLEFENELSLSKRVLEATFNQMIIEKKSFLTWSIACFEVLNKASVDELIELHEVDLNLFRKAHLSGAIAVWISLCNNLYDPEFIEDIYHITFFQDSGLIDLKYSYYITEALDKESSLPGEGIKYLISQNVSEGEIKLYKDHPFGSYEFIKRLNLLNNTELANTVLFGHELSNGSGFPFGHTESVLATWEKIIILSDRLVKYGATIDYDFVEGIEAIKSSVLDLLPVKKVLTRTLTAMTLALEKVSA